MSKSFSIDASEVKAFGTSIATVPAEMRRERQIANAGLLTEGVGLMQEYAPVDDGGLRASIGILKGPTPEGGSFGTSKIYAAQRNYGGTIVGRPWLVFQTKDGNWVKVRRVTQSGTHYKERTERALAPRVMRAHEAAVARVLARRGK